MGDTCATKYLSTPLLRDIELFLVWPFMNKSTVNNIFTSLLEYVPFFSGVNGIELLSHVHLTLLEMVK